MCKNCKTAPTCTTVNILVSSIALPNQKGFGIAGMNTPSNALLSSKMEIRQWKIVSFGGVSCVHAPQGLKRQAIIISWPPGNYSLRRSLEDRTLLLLHAQTSRVREKCERESVINGLYGNFSISNVRQDDTPTI